MSTDTLEALLNSQWYLDENFDEFLDVVDADGNTVFTFFEIGDRDVDLAVPELRLLAEHICLLHNEARPDRGTPADMLRQARRLEQQVKELIDTTESWNDNSPHATAANKFDTTADRAWLDKIRASIVTLEKLAAGATS